MKLLIYNNTNRFSTVLNAFLNEAKTSFEKVYVVFSKKHNPKKTYGDYDKRVEYLMPNISHKLLSLIFVFKDLLSLDSFNDFKLAKKRKYKILSFIKVYLRSLYVANLLYLTSKAVLKTSKKDKLAVFSTWYSENAIAAAKAKKKYKNIFVASYAHSYEIDFRKNKFTVAVKDRFKERHIDEVYFISSNVMEEYIRLNKGVLQYTKKYRAEHFGSYKKCEGYAKKSIDGVFRIVTCSGVNPIKRLVILAEALSLYKNTTPIEWTIMGDGSDLEKIKEIVNRIENKKVKVVFKGKISNDEVHQYYSSNYVDLFINISKSEGLPVSIMEAMSYKIPALATNVGGNHEIVNEKTGYPIEEDITKEALCNYLEMIVCNLAENDKKREHAYMMWDEFYRIDKNVPEIIRRIKCN